jgi:hypothetical protein
MGRGWNPRAPLADLGVLRRGSWDETRTRSFEEFLHVWESHGRVYRTFVS